MIADEERDPTMQRGKIEVEIREIIVAVAGCVGFGFVVGVGTVFMIQILSK
jgi:hypothetical protein